MDETNPTARALRCLQLLQDNPGITAPRLAAALEVSERAARRYVSVLRAAGIPVDSERGPYGGYRIGRGLPLPPLVFEAAEAIGLVMAVLDGHHDADADDPVGRALHKIMRALPEPVAAQAESVRRATAPAPDRSAARPHPETTSTVVQASSDRRRVRIDYRSEAGKQWQVDIDPWAVVVRHGRWYVVGWSHGADAVRVFRIDRVQRVAVLEAPFTPPEQLDPVGLLEDHLAVGWEYAAEVIIAGPIEQVGWYVPRSVGKLEVIDEGTTRLTGSTGNPSWYVEQLAHLPYPYRIVGCDEVRAAARAVGERMAAAGT